ncbi:MAG: hypothetical protein A3B37_00815 [Candidatus Sungbacteria bacterium RIFCSPLOWO2_01_FULL_59_16]|uniref:Glycosyltransferase RgtA/B/C/D-like domain-containing protein n=1 Tax=Candidatus Sungbacteria bacterium RIFCSPLOWO2_01_FULL_59_16 TaxID=1802280 RepID=A0A1G2LCZ5_9BACT|nr:MAG: hypothetical protein A3B37_00815 [Candidatus Sungbacteria bacterium RIFCSPLOWO2_01_FULL_59_16]
MSRIISRLGFRDSWECGIFIAGLGVRLAVFGLIVWGLDAASLWGSNDSREYLDLARGILGGRGFTQDLATPPLPEAIRTPAYPLYLSAFLGLGLPLWSAALIQLIAASFIPLITMRLAARLGVSEAGGRAAGFFMAFEPLGVWASTVILTDAFAGLAFLSGAFFLVRFWQERRLRHVVFAAVSFGLMNYIRPTGIYFAFLIPLCFLAAAVAADRARWRELLRAGAVFAALSLLILAPWVARNHLHFGRFTFVTGLDRQLLDYAASGVLAAAEGISFDAAQDRLQREIAPLLPRPPILKHPANGPVIRGYAKDVIREHPREFAKLYLLSLGTMFTAGDYHPLAADYGLIRWPEGGTSSFTLLLSRPDTGIADVASALARSFREPYLAIALLGRLLWTALMIFALFGLVAMWRQKPGARFGVILYLGFVLYLSLVAASLLVGVVPRHRLFLNPLTAIFAAAGALAMREAATRLLGRRS